MAGPPISARRTPSHGCSISTASAPLRAGKFPIPTKMSEKRQKQRWRTTATPYNIITWNSNGIRSRPPATSKSMGFGFDTAAEIFDDLDLFVVIDARTYGERRYQAIGASRGM